MKKKSIILVVLAVAVVGFCLYWFVIRKKDDSKTGASDAGTGTGSDNGASAGVLTSDYKAIINGLSLGQEQKNNLRYMVDYIKSDNAWYNSVKDKASANGRTADAQLVIDAAYHLYNSQNKLTQTEYELVCSKLD